jgi:hypothetical protein
MVEPSLEEIFPGLRGRSHQIKSPRDPKYNCIAFAAEDRGNWWWPGPDEEDTWPAGVARAQTVEAFSDAFGTLGYTVCEDDRLEAGYEKVAVFALAGVPNHAARQLLSGRWTSKLGVREDIEHDLHDLTGMLYGSVVLLLKRPLRPSAEETSGPEG